MLKTKQLVSFLTVDKLKSWRISLRRMRSGEFQGNVDRHMATPLLSVMWWWRQRKIPFPLPLPPVVSKGADPTTYQLQGKLHNRADPTYIVISELPRKHECERFDPYGGVGKGEMPSFHLATYDGWERQPCGRKSGELILPLTSFSA